MDINLHPRVLELVASRICHDLVSPVGAIGNGVELMQELGKDAGEEAMKLIADSAHQASLRLKTFRLCYGAAGTDKNIGFKDIRDAYQELLAGGRVKAEFAADIAAAVSSPPRGYLKTLLNLLILAEECAHGAGSVNVLSGGGGVRVTVAAENPRLREGAEAALKGESSPDDLDPRSVHPYVTGKFAASFGFKLGWSAPADGKMEFELSFQA